MENTAARKRRQVPEGYLVVGIDTHKKRHAAVAITQDFTTQANSTSGVPALHALKWEGSPPTGLTLGESLFLLITNSKASVTVPSRAKLT